MGSRRGYQFELETAAIAGKRGRRVPKSGSYGTTNGISKLAGDAIFELPWHSRTINVECKHGYSREGQKAKSMTLKKEWFDKHFAQSKEMDFYPMFAMKLKFTSENGLSKFFLVPFPVMKRLLEEQENMYQELLELKNESKADKNRKIH